jgi:ATP phosphoribosyltransferase regulatory subunit
MRPPRLPSGVRDYLPVEAARRRAIVSSLMGEFERWGYRPIITPIYEYDDVLDRGAATQQKSMRFVEPATGEVLALRPDLTPQVARLVATRLHDEPGPLRLAYEGSVVRLPAGELFQVGVELVDAPQPGGDLEMILLAVAALAATGVGDVAVDLGHAEVARAALDGLEVDPDALHAALQKKDAAAVEQLVAKVAPTRRKLVAALASLYGGPEVIARARGLVEKSARGALTALDELATLVERLHALVPSARLSIDLGEVRGLGYYTGTRFAVLSDGAGGALASGGRYDRLVERYGRPARATGFAVDVDRLGQVLRGAATPEAAGILVGGEPVLAARLAARLRAAGARAILDRQPTACCARAPRRRAWRAWRWRRRHACATSTWTAARAVRSPARRSSGSMTMEASTRSCRRGKVQDPWQMS